MAAAPKLTPAPWTQPGAPKVAGRPSWIGMLRANSLRPNPGLPEHATPRRSGASVRPDGSQQPSGASPSLRPPSAVSSVRPSMIPPAGVGAIAVPRPSAAPVPFLQSGRELELESEIFSLREELGRMAVELASVRSRVVEESESEIVRLAVIVAERVVGRELAADPALVHDWLREAIAAVPNQHEIVVAVAPDLASSVPPEAFAECKVMVDSSLRPGTCEVRAGSTVVPVGADERIAAISDALGVDRAS